MRLTVGPLPPAVYWRRRAIVLAGALLVLFVIFQACNASGAPGGQASGGRSPANSQEPPPKDPPKETLLRPTTPGPKDDGLDGGDGADEGDAPSEEGGPAGENASPDGELCADSDMLVTAEAARTELSPGESVRFTIWIRNDSTRTCSRDVGGDERELYLRQSIGASVVWSSRDCGAPTGTDVRQLTPAFEMERYLEWNGRVSSSCRNGDGAEPDGPVVDVGEYDLVARLGTVHSEPITVTVR